MPSRTWKQATIWSVLPQRIGLALMGLNCRMGDLLVEQQQTVLKAKSPAMVQITKECGGFSLAGGLQAQA